MSETEFPSTLGSQYMCSLPQPFFDATKRTPAPHGCGLPKPVARYSNPVSPSYGLLMAPPPPEILPSKLGDPQPRRREEGRFPRRPHDVSDLPHHLRRRDLRLPSSHAAAAHFRRHPRLAAGPRPREHLLLPVRPGGSPRPSSAQDNDRCQSCHRLLRLCGERQPIILVDATCSLLRSHARIFFSSSFNATPPEFEGYGHPILRH